MSGGREQAHLYPLIIEYLKPYGDVLTEFVGDQKYSPLGDWGMTPEAIYRRDQDYIRRCEVMVAEVTIPSLGVGVEIAQAGMQGKPVLALYQPRKHRKLSAMVSGDPNVTVAEYRTAEEVKEAIERFLNGRMTSSSR
jgi:hypothetical protein